MAKCNQLTSLSFKGLSITIKLSVIMKAEAAAEVYPSDISDESQEADDVDDDVNDDRSCLGIRRRCLGESAECNRALHEHRRYCRESSRLLHCSAVEWYAVCFT